MAMYRLSFSLVLRIKCNETAKIIVCMVRFAFFNFTCRNWLYLFRFSKAFCLIVSPLCLLAESMIG